ncbi:DUF262 domain-containing protein [Polaribacter pectinis]|uniref:DUF262 domain-containing protein n=1 Tax=Polaribacter pectinis TaxID=2738844 RepID=A0A7G9L7I6_9FLAO|nr:DUF262 domain-containing protein [Polaribacter pectinis]QNM84585.1 DUF262 domain-containing protein [Polaribacter pectinis]
MIKVKTLNYLDIFKEFPNLVVPDYQRAYTWNTDKIEDLINDWQEFLGNKNSKNISYYMGTLLFYLNKEKDKFEIIDGQQRLSSLALVYHCIHNNILKEQNLSHNQYTSAHNIVKNYSYLLQRKQELAILKEYDILNKLQFTIIVSDNEDNAFTFFDSQNNRGVTLGVDDYLKAYHLRAVQESNQEKMAKDWEAITFFARKNDKLELNLEYLFKDILFKSRQWKGQRSFPYKNKDNVLREFQKQTHKIKKGEQNYRLFANQNNMRFHSLEYQEDNSLVMLSRERIVDTNHFPFSIRQPLFEGHNFFLFTQKYHSIYKFIFFDKHPENSDLNSVRKMYDDIYNNDMSNYLKEYIQLCLVMYFDNFGVEYIVKALQHFDFYIGSIRVEKYYVRSEVVKNSLKNAKNNLLDVIQGAYLPSEIFNFIKSQENISKIYTNKQKYINDKGEYRNNVIERYIERVCKSYKKEKNKFENRKIWLV